MPSPAESNGRDSSGRFAAGNKHGRGNPLAQQAQKLRVALLGAVTEEDIEAIIARLIESAKAGDVVAAREVLDRTIGKASQKELLQRIEELEKTMEGTGAYEHSRAN